MYRSYYCYHYNNIIIIIIIISMSIYIYIHTYTRTHCGLQQDHSHCYRHEHIFLAADWRPSRCFHRTSSIKILHHNAISKQFQLYLCNLLMWYMVMTWGWFVADPTLPWPSRRAPPRLPSTSSGVLRDPRSWALKRCHPSKISDYSDSD